MNTKYNFTREQVVAAAVGAKSRTDMMRVLGIKQGGGGYQALDFWCRKYGVTPPDGRNVGNANLTNTFIAMSDDEWFASDTRRSGQASRKRLVSRGVPDICSECGQEPIWNAKPLVLQLDHIDGDRWNNTIENLRILCPNCHTQTETYANTGRQKRRYYCECGCEISKKSNKCVKCANEARGTKIDWPSVDEVIKQVRLTNFLQYGKILGVSDNAIRKFLRSNGIDPKTLLPVGV